jgi:hypothetical protein
MNLLMNKFTSSAREKIYFYFLTKTKSDLIHPATPSLKGWNKNIYLQPGEEMQYDTEKMHVAVGKIVNTNNTSLKRMPLSPAAKKANAVANHNLPFNSSPLSEVLKQLAQYYSAKIEFDEAEIKEMSLTSEISKKRFLTCSVKDYCSNERI